MKLFVYSFFVGIKVLELDFKGVYFLFFMRSRMFWEIEGFFLGRCCEIDLGVCLGESGVEGVESCILKLFGEYVI